MASRHRIILTALVVAISPISASAFTTVNRQTVNPLPSGGFEVVARAGAFTDDYWCAAGDYARRALKLPWKTQLYVSRGMGQSVTTGRRSAVQFSTDASAVQPPANPSRPTPSQLVPGFDQSVTAAFGRCDYLRPPYSIFGDR